MRRLAGMLACLCLVGAASAPPAVQDDAAAAFRSGRYDEAIAVWEAALADRSVTVAQVRMLVEALRATGRSARAAAAARAFSEAGNAAEIANRWGEALYERGQIEAARARFHLAIDEGAPDALVAELNLAVLEFENGERDSAAQRFDRFIDVYNSATTLNAEELVAVGLACSYLGRDNPSLFHDAVRALEEAIAADPESAEPRLRLAELFLAKYDGAEAGILIEEVLRLNPSHAGAHLAEARRHHFNGLSEAMAQVDRALELNPELVPARALRARLLLAAESHTAAEAEIERALESNPVSQEALSLMAALHFLRGEQGAFDDVAERALARDPNYGELFAVVAELAVQNRLYEQAVDLARRATEIDPSLWGAHGTLGINLMRIARIDDARASLERAFEGDPFNVWIKNTLDLLDTFPEYRTVKTDRFRLMIRRERADLVSLYMAPLAEEAYAALSAKYGFQSPSPVRVEVYDRHADFSVRTLGLAGLGALGVAFGPVVAVDAPMTPGMGSFNWGTTLWHEIAHVVTLGVTDSRVPRWLSEGLSVYEERRAREAWGDDATPGFLLAFLRGQLLPVSRINEGFARPSYPEHLAHSYLQASLVCELIEEELGFDAVLALLDAYRDGKTGDEAIRVGLALEPAELDARFDEFLRARYAGPLRALEAAAERPPSRGRQGMDPASLKALADADTTDFVAHLSVGAALASQGSDEAIDEAIGYLERAKRLFPGYAGPDSPYVHLARIHEERGNVAAAAAELRMLLSLNESLLPAYLKGAELLEQLGRASEAADLLGRSMFIDPWNIARHERLAELRERLEQWSEAARERAAVVALGPVDRASALYRLAYAHDRQGDARAARRAVIAALEIAPGYQEAQELLLAIRAREGA
ncbi:MAG TPA: tetratricopeptide repeat protein [Acidobacteriota bacterium]|nr:tetratricopeptide repeat protein [Acidobacteriota bacterium]